MELAEEKKSWARLPEFSGNELPILLIHPHPAEADACRIKVIRIRVGPHEGVPQYEGAASQSETGMRIREIERTYGYVKYVYFG